MLVGQMLVVLCVTVRTGAAPLTVICNKAIALQPLVFVCTTLKVGVPLGLLTMIEVVLVGPVLHEYVPLALVVRVTVAPEHTAVGPVIEIGDLVVLLAHARILRGGPGSAGANITPPQGAILRAGPAAPGVSAGR